MTLYTKCILSAPSYVDRVRISVMSRHTLNDGITPDERITSEKFNLHVPELAPPLKLIGDYYKRNLPWEKFEERYLEYLRENKISALVKRLSQDALVEDFTLLCIEESPERCHRRLLAEECKRYNPSLILSIG